MARRSVVPPAVTRRGSVVELLHGVEVADPYRWLEDANSPETQEWLAEQHEHAARYFASIAPEPIRRRLAELMRTDEIGIPHERRGYYYFSRRLAYEQRYSICRRFGLDGPDEVLIDPSAISADPTIGIELRDVTPDGALVCFLVRHGGEDEAEIRVVQVDSQRTIDSLPGLNRHFPSGSMTTPATTTLCGMTTGAAFDFIDSGRPVPRIATF